MATRPPRPPRPAVPPRSPDLALRRRTSRFCAPLLALLVAGSAVAQDGPSTIVVVPLDLSQGAVTNVEGPTPYVASLKLQVALGLGERGEFRIGPVAAVRYANPDWVAAGGIRAQWLPVRIDFPAIGRWWAVGVAAEQLWDTGDGRPASAGVVADLELVRLAAWLVHDWNDERTGFELSVGTGLRSLWAALVTREDEPPFQNVP